MPLTLYPKCWRYRTDCEPIQCIDAAPPSITDAQLQQFNYVPLSFVCSGCVVNPVVARDRYRLCFKNADTDEMSDNDLQDLTSLITVAAAALTVDAVRKVNRGIVEIPAENDA